MIERVHSFILSAPFTVITANHSYISFCYRDPVDATVVIFMSNIMNLGMNLSLLCMFNRSLYRVNKQMMIQYLTDNHSMTISSKQNQNVHASEHITDQVSIDIVLEEYGASKAKNETNKQMELSVKEIMELHNLIKKQSILVGIAVSSTLMLGISVYMNDWMIMEIGWDFSVNAICVWLMLNCSKKYWMCCRKYGLCKCCYCSADVVAL